MENFQVINYLVKCFSYGIAQNKGNPKGIQATNQLTVPHAFGDHTNCGVDSRKIPFYINIRTFHMEKTNLVTS